MGAVIPIVAAVVGAVAKNDSSRRQAHAVQDAARTSAEASAYAADLQKEMFDKQVELQEPWRQAGVGALNRLTAGLGAGGEFSTKFSDTNWQTDPGYQFRLKEGINALNRQSAARGGLMSGAALKAATRYGQDMASQEYQNAFNRYYAERDNNLRPLQSLAGLGQTSATVLGNAAGNYANNAGNIALGNAANQGNALLTGANIRASQYGSYGNLLEKLFNADWDKIGSYFDGGDFGGGGGGDFGGGGGGDFGGGESGDFV